MIKPITISNEVNELSYDKLKDVLDVIHASQPTNEELLNQKITSWFYQEYPHIDMANLEEVKKIIERDNLSIVRTNDFSFGCILKDGIPVFRTGSGKLGIINTAPDYKDWL